MAATGRAPYKAVLTHGEAGGTPAPHPACVPTSVLAAIAVRAAASMTAGTQRSSECGCTDSRRRVSQNGKPLSCAGFVLDERGVKMSKSIGNVVDPRVVMEGGKDAKVQPPPPPPFPTCAPLLSSLCREALHSQCRMLFGTLHVQAPVFEFVLRHGRMQSGISLHLRMLTEDARQRSVSSSGSVSSAAVRQASVAGHVLGFLSFCKLAFICSIHTCCCTALSTAVLSAC